MQQEKDNALGKATAEAADQMSSDSGSGGGSGSSSAISYGEQASLADTEKASVLREFGSNFSPTSGASAAGAMVGAATAAVAGAIMGGGAAGGDVAAAGLGTNMTGGNPGGALGFAGGVGSVAAGAKAAGGAMTAPQQAASGGGGGAGSVDNSTVKNVTVNNTFANVPPDPHTFAKGVEFEIGATV